MAPQIKASELSVLTRRPIVEHAVRPDGAATTVPPPTARWRSRVLLPAVLLACLLGLLAWSARDVLWPPLKVRVVPVVVRSVQETGGGVTVQAPGWVEPDPYPLNVSALADGVLKEVLVLEGERVAAGQVVARMVDDDARLACAAAIADRRQRQAELQSARAARAAAKQDWENPVERTRAVEAAEAMLAGARGELERLPAEVAADTARLKELEDVARRALEAGDAASASERVQAKLRADAQRQMLAATEAKRPALEAKVRQYEAELTAARRGAELRTAERQALDEAAAAVAQAEAALARSTIMCEEADLRLSRMEVRSPVGGVVLARLAEPGRKLMFDSDMEHSAHALRLYDPKKLQVRVDVPLADAAQVGAGQEARIVVGVLPDRTFKGRVTRLVHEADIQRNTVQVKVAIDDPAPELKPEMLARVKFVAPVRQVGTDSQAQQVFAPESLLRREGDAVTAWIVDKGRGVAERRAVTLGEARRDGWVSVASGLQPGDVIIAGETSHLHEGHKVQIVGEAEAPAAGGAEGGGGRGAH